MKVFLSVGHSLLKGGCYTSASGFCNEYRYNKKLVKYVKKELVKKGYTVDIVVCPERKFTHTNQERTYKLDKEGKGHYDLAIELHLNASCYTSSNGSEVLYYSKSGAVIANKIQRGLSTIFRDRGVKYRDDLYMLKGTHATAVIVESFFCTSRDDYAKAKGTKNVKKLAKAITKYL